jgi:site-specific DNA-methyltransferase (adenine-specific)
MKIINIKIDDLKPYENNPRFNDDAVEYVAKSIKEFGFKVPLVVDKNNVIVTGHTRYKAGLELGLKELPCIIADDLTDEQVKLFRLADNKVSEVSSWNYELLGEEIDKIKGLDLQEFGFPIDDDTLDFIENIMDSGIADTSVDFNLDKISVEFDIEYEDKVKEVISEVGKLKIIDEVLTRIEEGKDA